jgi:predicted patatin/cPLA2 family phospholipase
VGLEREKFVESRYTFWSVNLGNLTERCKDGGGIRGYWTLLVLERLMAAIGDEERLKAGTIDTASNLHSFLPEDKPQHVTQCNVENLSARDLDAYNFLPCHYFDFICGSSTGR